MTSITGRLSLRKRIVFWLVSNFACIFVKLWSYIYHISFISSKECLPTPSSFPQLSWCRFHRLTTWDNFVRFLWKTRRTEISTISRRMGAQKARLSATNLVKDFVSTIFKAVTMAELRRPFKSHMLWTTKALVHKAKSTQIFWKFLLDVLFLWSFLDLSQTVANPVWADTVATKLCFRKC